MSRRSYLVAGRKFGPTARSYASSRLLGMLGLRVNEVRRLAWCGPRHDFTRFDRHVHANPDNPALVHSPCWHRASPR